MESSVWEVISKIKVIISSISTKLTMMREVEQDWQILAASGRVTRVGESRVRIPQFIKEWMNHGVHSRQSLSRRVLKQARDQVDRIWVRLTEHLD